MSECLFGSLPRETTKRSRGEGGKGTTHSTTETTGREKKSHRVGRLREIENIMEDLRSADEASHHLHPDSSHSEITVAVTTD